MAADAWCPPPWLDKGPTAGSYAVPTVIHPFARAFDVADWRQRCLEWADGGRTDSKVLGPYASLAEPRGRFVVLWRSQPGYGWPEARVALAMMDAGFTCWTGAQLFRRDERQVRSKLLKASTDEVESLLRDAGYPLPRDYHHRFAPESLPLRNPDLVCFNKSTREWRFIEVKWKDRVAARQLNALAFLHDLIGARVEIRRLWPQDRAWQQPEPAGGAYRLLR